MNVAVLGDEYLVWGMMLAGVKRAKVVLNPEEAVTLLQEWLRDPEIGVIVLPEKLAAEIRPEIEAARKKKTLYPIIIEVMTYKEISNVPRSPGDELVAMMGMGRPGNVGLHD
jgi:vacuolar-type H+-ATPase subunit F/Vma7